MAYFVGQASQGDIEMILYAALAVVIYLVLFVWYAKEMKKRNAEYAEKKA